MTETIYIIELIRASLEQRKAEEKPENILWEKLYELVGVHMVSSITFYQIDKLEKKPPQQIYRLWKEKAEKALVKEISFDAERRIILEKFEQAGIKYIPLKGIILKDYYAAPGLRQFSDNDILFEKSRREDVFQIMTQLGYTGDIEAGNHDVYKKDPIYNFEMHTALLPSENRLRAEFENIWEKAKKDKENNYGYHMSKTDFYLFHMVHLNKHFEGCGTGLRYFVDEYYLMKDPEITEKQEEIDRRLEEMELLEFKQKIRKLTQIMFCRKIEDISHLFDENPEMRPVFDYVMSCGAYGTIDVFINNRMKKSGNKFRYFLSRLNCEEEYLRHDYPVLRKHPRLRPVFLVYRLISAPFKKPDRVKAEFKALFSKNKPGKQNKK